MTKTPLLLVPGLLCSPRLFAAQLSGLSAEADIVVPDWRTAPLGVWDTWESAARWVLDQMPAQKFALAGLSLGGMLAVEIMQLAADRVTRLALLDTGMRSQNDVERSIRRARIRLANEGHFELVLGLQMSRFIPAYRPTIVVCGRDDAATPLFLSEEVAAAIKGSELIVIEQCGHLITMEKPEETNAILRKWLD